MLSTGDIELGLVAVDFQQEIKQLRNTMDSVREVTDLASVQQQITELEAKASVPDLWDDPDAAQKVTSALPRANSEYARVTGMEQRLDDLEVLVEMATEDGGDAETDEAEQRAGHPPEGASASSRCRPC